MRRFGGGVVDESRKKDFRFGDNVGGVDAKRFGVSLVPLSRGVGQALDG